MSLPRAWLRRGLVLGLLLLSMGCVWLRLLEIKNQLNEFGEYFRIEIADHHFVVHFLEPVLLSEDVVYLSKLQPSRAMALPGGESRWALDFRMHPPRTRQQADLVISFEMGFDAEHRLRIFDFPPLFLELAPPAFLEASIRGLGAGKVDQGKRQLRVAPEHLPKLSAPLPNRTAIVAVMGPPEEDYVYDRLRILRYRFLAESHPISPEFEERREAEAKLFFDPATDRLVRLAGRFAGLKLSIDYRNLSAKRTGGPDPAPQLRPEGPPAGGSSEPVP